MADLLLAVMLEPMAVGRRFNLWPAHITVLPWFSAPDSARAAAAFGAELGALSPFEAAVGDLASFGQRARPVRLVKDTPPLRELHQRALTIAADNNWPVQGRYTGAYFRPHITIRPDQTTPDRLWIDHVYLFESLPQGYRQAVARIDLPGNRRRS